MYKSFFITRACCIWPLAPGRGGGGRDFAPGGTGAALAGGGAERWGAGRDGADEGSLLIQELSTGGGGPIL